MKCLKIKVTDRLLIQAQIRSGEWVEPKVNGLDKKWMVISHEGVKWDGLK